MFDVADLPVMTFGNSELTLSPRKAKIPVCRSLIYSRKDEISAWKCRKKLLTIMLCLGAADLGTPCCGNSGARGLKAGVNK